MSKSKFWMLTSEGSVVTENFGVPSVKDIAQGLSRIPRYNGASEKMICIAKHCLFVERLIKNSPELSKMSDEKEKLKIRLYGLLHDAAEVIVGDTPSTFKPEESQIAEKKILKRIFESVGLPPEPTDYVWTIVKKYDKMSLSMEVLYYEYGPPHLSNFVKPVPDEDLYHFDECAEVIFDWSFMREESQQRISKTFQETATELIVKYNSLDKISEKKNNDLESV